MSRKCVVIGGALCCLRDGEYLTEQDKAILTEFIEYCRQQSKPPPIRDIIMEEQRREHYWQKRLRVVAKGVLTAKALACYNRFNVKVKGAKTHGTRPKQTRSRRR